MASFVMPSLKVDRRALLRGALAAGTTGLLPDEGLATAKPGSLDAIARSRGLRFGTAVSERQLANPELASLIAAECGIVGAENALKWKRLEPQQGRYQTADADSLARFAVRQHLQLRGHTFVWNQDNRIPTWMLANETSLAAEGAKGLIATMERHCDFVIRRYPQIASWDAVNEVIQVKDGAMRSSLFSRALGDRFIDLAFTMMREKAPRLQLVYNDYMSWDAKPEHRNGVLRMLEAALKRGVPIDALGIQSHIGNTLGRPIDELAWRRFLEQVEGMGLDIVITELDCSDRNIASQDPARRDAETAAFLKGYMDLTLSFSRVRQILAWSLSDYDSYMNRPGYPLERRRSDGLSLRGHFFDELCRPKLLAQAISDAILAAPIR